MSLQNSHSATYQIEISGWDRAENFFVEKADLEWSEDHSKKVSLRHELRDGAVVFVRLLASTAPSHALPIAYLAENTNSTDFAGRRVVRLGQLHPRSSEPGAASRMPAEVVANKR